MHTGNNRASRGVVILPEIKTVTPSEGSLLGGQWIQVYGENFCYDCGKCGDAEKRKKRETNEVDDKPVQPKENPPYQIQFSGCKVQEITGLLKFECRRLYARYLRIVETLGYSELQMLVIL